MILHIKDKDAPIREASLDQVKFEFRNKIISNSALYWKAGMSEWSRLDQLPEIKEISVQSPKEERIGENWLYRQIDARRHFSEAPNLNQSQDATTKWKWVKILSSTGFILVYIFACALFISAAITRNENHNPTLGVLLGLILFRRIFRLQSEQTITKKPDRSFLRFYLHSSAWAFTKWIIYLAPVCIFAVLDAETASEFGANLARCFGIYICTILLSLDAPIWTWRKRKEYAEAGYPPKNMTWAIAGGIAIPLFAIGLVTMLIPAFKNSLERAKIVSEAAEASKTAEAQTNATPAPWSPSAEELIDPQTATSGAPTKTAVSQKVYGKSKAYSLILPPEWEVTDQFPENDLSAQNKLLFFHVMYFKESSKTAIELLDILKARLHKDGATDFSNEFIYNIYGIRWNAFTCAIRILGDQTGSITNMIYKNDKGIFILIFGSAVEAEIDTRKFFNPILDSFTIL